MSGCGGQRTPGKAIPQHVLVPVWRFCTVWLKSGEPNSLGSPQVPQTNEFVCNAPWECKGKGKCKGFVCEHIPVHHRSSWMAAGLVALPEERGRSTSGGKWDWQVGPTTTTHPHKKRFTFYSFTGPCWVSLAGRPKRKTMIVRGSAVYKVGSRLWHSIHNFLKKK